MLDRESFYRLREERVTVHEIARQFDTTATGVRERLEPFVDEQDSIPGDIAAAILLLVNQDSPTAKTLIERATFVGTPGRQWDRG